MKILILSDSLALPREEPEECSYEKTWPQLLRREGHIVHQVSIGGATSVDLLRQCNYHKSFDPDIVIIQVGIVDCAPRFISKKEKYFLQRLPFIGDYILKKLNKPIIRKIRSLTYVPIPNFKIYCEKIYNHFSDISDVYFVEIIGEEGYEEKLPNVHANILRYNNVLKSINNAGFIEYWTHGITMSDFHHVNEKGHRILFEKITHRIVLKQ